MMIKGSCGVTCCLMNTKHQSSRTEFYANVPTLGTSHLLPFSLETVKILSFRMLFNSMLNLLNVYNERVSKLAILNSELLS